MSKCTIVVVVAGLIRGVSSRGRHVVGRKSREMASRAVHAMAIVGVVTVGVVGRRRSSVVLTLDLSSLRSSLGEHGDITTTVVV